MCVCVQNVDAERGQRVVRCARDARTIHATSQHVTDDVCTPFVSAAADFYRGSRGQLMGRCLCVCVQLCYVWFGSRFSVPFAARAFFGGRPRIVYSRCHLCVCVFGHVWLSVVYGWFFSLGFVDGKRGAHNAEVIRLE